MLDIFGRGVNSSLSKTAHLRSNSGPETIPYWQAGFPKTPVLTGCIGPNRARNTQYCQFFYSLRMIELTRSPSLTQRSTLSYSSRRSCYPAGPTPKSEVCSILPGQNLFEHAAFLSL